MKQTRIAKPSIRTSVLISPEFYNLAKTNLIMFSEAMRVGISILLAERGVAPYDNALNITRKMNFFREQAEAANHKAEELQKKLEKMEK